MRSNFNSMISQGLEEKYLKANATSGSTGSNLKFYSDKKQRNGQALVLRANKWLTGKYFPRELRIWGAPWDVSFKKKLLPKLKDYFKNTRMVSGYHLSDDDMKKYLEMIKKWKPELITSYPSILFSMAEYFEKQGFSYKPKAVKSAGEKLHAYQREKIEKVFQTRVFDFYGGRDIPMIAQECEHHNGLHQMMESVVMEVIDKDGNLIQEGEGELVMTHLNNRAMPFIRYKIGDHVRISNNTCSCGRGLKVIDEVLGRSFEIIQFPNGNRVGGTFWTFVMKSVKGIKDFQVVHRDEKSFLINYIPENQDINIDFNKLSTNIKDYGGDHIDIEFKKVELIPPTKGGKHQFVVKQF